MSKLVLEFDGCFFYCTTKIEEQCLEPPIASSSSGPSSFVHTSLVLKQRHSFAVKSTSADVCTTFDGSVEGVSSHTVEERVGVLLLNLGGPETLNDVQPFLFNLFADPDIIRLPRLFRFLQRPLAKLISTFRAPKSKEAYASIGGGSPLRKITNEQANALKLALQKKNLHADIYMLECVLVVLPLYPQYSISTSGSSIRVLQNIVNEDSYFAALPVSIIESWYQRDGYVKSMAELIQKELSIFANPEEVMIFFSAHGVPLTYVKDAGDPYRDQMEDCITLIMEELRSRGILNSHTLAYQSRVGPVQWLKPFVSEHIETLEEIDIEYKELALESGIENWGRVPALGCTSSFISDLADAVIEALPSASAITTRKGINADSDMDLRRYLSKMFFGSILAFILLLSPRMISTFRNNLL
ncbi:hypothetical protein BRADI_3g60407v3 [Brachypodium distachyon]|uniref:Ferrochelatase n=1 Tax=Brachypodium distachyon TaxID=15368 RepID=A0A0Q3FSQ9_BRADI|nr:hypothetical protein BRADI_3g60407v3 [Brachypodium distachyon]